jgi:hypothetical protein
MPRIDFPQLAGVDKLMELTRGLERRPSIRPEVFAPLRPPRDHDQDERFERLTAVVVAQTDEIVELQGEVREVKASAARDAHRERVQSMRRDRASVRLQWWHLLLAAVLAAVLGAIATKLIA